MFAPADGRPPGVAEKLAAGAATGVLKTMLFYPLDVARVHLTAAVPPYGRCAATAGGADGTVRGALSDAVARNGVRGLYHGLLLSMAGVVPYLSLSFTAYDVLKQQLPETRAAHAAWWYPLAKMGCGAAAAAAAQTVTYPLDTVRRRLQVSSAPGQSVRYWSALHCVREMVAREGFASLYRGCAVNIMKTAPGAAIQFVAYDFIKTSIVAIDPRAGVQSPL
uniref:ADP,ATP carrier protein n=1 Tax=Chlamydomonas euryale TaxID=1486919 RepID=A0A7R9Z3T0_9CHLO|mmetsp:Transcript_43219/g.129681  ORF Transcript_43219/g.129681 Transcript_43219/m.129681 type:complete len:221 (+) Transcript_43219:1061-1723(+)